MKLVFIIFPFLISICSLAQDTIYTESKIEIVNGEVPAEDSRYSQYHSLVAYTGQGIEVFNETHIIEDYGVYFIHQTDSENQSTYCHGNDNYLTCVRTIRDTVLNMEYDYSQGDTVAIRKLYFDQEKLVKSECIYGCEYAISYTYNGDTLTEFKRITDSTYMYSYSIFDKRDRLIFNIWGSQKPIFEGFYYFDTFEWDDENRTCLKKTSASNATPYNIEATFYDDDWIPLRKEVAHKNKTRLFDKYTIRFTRDFDTNLSMSSFPEKWIGLTETDTGQVIFNHCAGGDYKILITEIDGKKTLLEYGEQEDSEYWINKISSKKNKIVFSVECKLSGKKGNFTFQWVDQSKGIGSWTSNVPKISKRNGLFVFENFRNHFPIIDQPCVECWGDECDD
ncbi:MAG: hypothetical protein QNK23_06150 [Crocinitomicaceae bacterium]|nr:hypothetical protein [Crocinitomicaceae bacterium]